jgi:hypothetical protein
MSQMDAAISKFDLIDGTATEGIQWLLHVSKELATETITTKKDEIRYPLSLWLWYSQCVQIAAHEDARIHECMRGINVLEDPKVVAMNAKYLHEKFQYPLSNLPQGQEDFLDTSGRIVRIDSSFKEKYDQLTSVPLKLISQVQKAIGDTMQKYALNSLIMNQPDLDFLFASRYLQFQSTRLVGLIYAEEDYLRHEYLTMISRPLMKMELIAELLKTIEPLIMAMEILECKPRGGLNKTVTKLLMSNVLNNTAGLPDPVKDRLRDLNGHWRKQWDLDKSPSIPEFQGLLH